MNQSKLLFVINNRSGAGRGAKIVHALRGYIGPTDPSIRVAELGSELAKQQLEVATKDDLVVIGGGDGTVSRLLGMLKDRGCRVGILPLGTGNDLARELGVFDSVRGASPEQLISFYRSAHTRPVTLFALEYGPQYQSVVNFVNYVSFGFDAKVVSEFGQRRDRFFWRWFQGVWTNRLGYAFWCVRFLTYRLSKGVIVIGGDVHYQINTPKSLIFTNIRSIMGLGTSNDVSNPFDEQIECLAVKNIINYLSMVIRRCPTPLRPQLVGAESSWELISTDAALPVQIDGESHPEICGIAVRIRVAGAVPMVVGSSSSAKEN